MNYENTQNLSRDFLNLLKNTNDYNVKIIVVLLKYIYTGKLSIEKNKISFVDVFIASDELELMEVCQQIEERLLENESAWKLPIDYITICQYENFTKLNDVALALVCRKPLVMFESKEFLRMEEKLKMQQSSQAGSIRKK
ncbi:unnamed protein product [Rhizophagus irregularis]|nr:unnamed protein product [Rhizophagus irregularis]